MRYKLLVNIVGVSIILLWSCNSEKSMIKFYNRNKTELSKIKYLSSDLFLRYKFKYASLRELEKDIGIHLSVHEQDAFKGAGEYFDKKTLMPTADSSTILNICDSCTEEERKMYYSLLKDNTLKEILKLYVKTNPRALQITSKGVFFALGDDIKRPYNAEVESGILMAFNKNINKALVIREIDEDVYLFETVVE